MTGAPIFAGFVALAGLLCWLLIYGRGHWTLKAATTVGVLAFSFAVWHALDSYAGWPAAQQTPAHAVFVHGIVVDPDPAHGTSGAIYLWLIPTGRDHSVLGYHNTLNEPRAFRVPYSTEEAEAVQRAEHMQAQGSVVGFDKSHRHHAHGPHGTSSGQHVPDVHVYRLPPPQPQRKGGS